MILKGIEGILIECNFIKRDFVERRNFVGRKFSLSAVSSTQFRKVRDVGILDNDPQGILKRSSMVLNGPQAQEFSRGANFVERNIVKRGILVFQPMVLKGSS